MMITSEIPNNLPIPSQNLVSSQCLRLKALAFCRRRHSTAPQDPKVLVPHSLGTEAGSRTLFIQEHLIHYKLPSQPTADSFWKYKQKETPG